jgi:hypothetical protein
LRVLPSSPPTCRGAGANQPLNIGLRSFCPVLERLIKPFLPGTASAYQSVCGPASPTASPESEF